ncbi:MAG TPA: L-threonylcarbamoyladenylate synthase [Kofleriaceae bacterium]|nr:L-threonylcarbamoyladenylate synthase [Kofleriaceae bacterium]
MAPAPDPRAIAGAARALIAGDIVCMPTETTYGLAVDARDTAATGRLSVLKDRPPGVPFAVIAPDIAAARALARTWPAEAENLARRWWPGPLTLVVPARADLPVELVGPGGGVGVRISSHPWAHALACALGGAITATSANPSGQPAAESVATARTYFGSRVGVYLDAGPSPSPVPSTVVTIAASGAARILREGAISAAMLDLPAA